MTDAYTSDRERRCLLRCEGVKRLFRSGDSKLEVLNGVDLELYSGESLSILGESGSGKSTLLHILGLLDVPDAGKIWYDGNGTEGITERGRERIRNERTGFIFQFHHLLPEFTLLENVMMPAMIRGGRQSGLRDRAVDLCDSLGLDGKLGQLPSTLSGGESQRAAIARALMNDPDMIFADEPSGNLDARNSAIVHDLLLKLTAEGKKSVLIVTHNHELASQTDRVFILEEGTLHESGKER